MNKFELFCMIYYVLDAVWDETKDSKLGEYLSGANPFFFEDLGSADPAVFNCFCEIITEPITVENCYDKAKRYILSLNDEILSNAFFSIDEDEWNEGMIDFLSAHHKGQ